MATPEIVFPSPGAGQVKWVLEATPNNSDKSWTVPAGHVWEMIWIHAELTTTATAGNRVLRLQITNGTDAVANLNTSGSTAASKTVCSRINFGGGCFSTTGLEYGTRLSGVNPDAAYNQSVGRMLLPAGHVIHIWDAAAIDAAADDLSVVLHYIDYAVNQT